MTYSLSEPARVSVDVIDPDGAQVVQLESEARHEAGRHVVPWDGLDSDGKVVPDEAYAARISVSDGAVWDPTKHSGGQVGDITTARFDEVGGVLVYQLPAPARVLIRGGVHNGPMLKTLVDWKPRVAGSISEPWDGRDEDHLVTLAAHKDFAALITYVTLPEATVIAYGNDKETYREYKLGRGRGRAQVTGSESGAAGNARLKGLVPPAWARAPHVQVTFPKMDAAVPEVKDAVDVHVEVDPSDRDYLLREQFEVIFFVDNVFFSEAERGYLPLNWRWELQQIPAGEHILTVNISSFKGQVGVASRKVKVVKDPQ